MNKPFHIAIDGPVAAGKGTVSRLVADELSFLYVDTGAMYRVSALIGIRNHIDLSQEKKLVSLVKKAKISMRNPNQKEKDGRLTSVFLDSEDVSWTIRTEEVGQGASQVAVHSQLRKALVKKQQHIAKNQNVIMEGRDITSVVLPNADLKIFLTANDVIRSKRRHHQLLTKGFRISFEQVYQNLLKRDERDKSRAINPLIVAPDAWTIDTSDLSIEQVIRLVSSKAKVIMETRA